MKKIIGFIIIAISLSIAATYPSALRLPVGQVDEERITEVQAEEALRKKLTDMLDAMGISVIEHKLVRGEEYDHYRYSMKMITPGQFESAIKQAKRILSEYTDFEVVYRDFLFSKVNNVTGGKRHVLSALSAINLFPRGMRTSKTLDIRARDLVKAVVKNDKGISPENAAMTGELVVKQKGEFKRDAQDDSEGAIPILGDLSYEVTFNFAEGNRTVKVKGRFQELTGRQILYNIGDTYNEYIREDVMEFAVPHILLRKMQEIYPDLSEALAETRRLQKKPIIKVTDPINNNFIRFDLQETISDFVKAMGISNKQFNEAVERAEELLKKYGDFEVIRKGSQLEIRPPREQGITKTSAGFFRDLIRRIFGPARSAI